MKVLKRLLISLAVIVGVFALLFLGGYLFVRIKYEIDPIRTIKEFRTLGAEVNEEELCPNAFSSSDMLDVKAEVNQSVEDFVVESEENGYSLNYDRLPEEMRFVIKLTDKMVGALAETMLQQELDGKIGVGGKELGLSLRQVTFSDVKDGNADFNAIILLDARQFKTEMTSFPFNYLKKFIPDYFYISSTVRVTKGEQPFAYSVSHRALTVNNLSAEDTEDFLHTVDTFLKIGTASELNEKIGDTFVGMLVGSESQRGFAYSLKEIGAEDYEFLSEGGKQYFAVNCDDSLSTVTPDDGHTHVPMVISDAAQHWKVCKLCKMQMTEKEAHSAPVYAKNKTTHYKTCTTCGRKFAESAHESGTSCSVCGYTADYAEKCASRYGYDYLGTLTKGSGYQRFYEKLDAAAYAFHDDGGKTASIVDLGGDRSYVAGKIGFSEYGLSSDEAMSVWVTYRADHPLYYWIAGNVAYSSDSLYLCVDSDYAIGSVRTEKNALIYDALDRYLNAVSGETSDYHVAFGLHDEIIKNIDYAYNGSVPESANWAHSIVGVFVNGKAVCEGYAKAFSLLLNASGVENAYVTGTGKSERHAWNLVSIDGSWYWYDLTWDDQPKLEGGIVYDYLCKTSAEFSDHTVDAEGNMTSPMSFQYALPSVAVNKYNTEALEYGETFKIDNKYEYMVSGYKKLTLVSTTSVSGKVVLQGSITRGARTYSLVKIGENAFRNNILISEIHIPDSVKTIENFAFLGCANLKRATFEDAEGWKRHSKNIEQDVLPASLENATKAAILLKETLAQGSMQYQYVWSKSAAA